MSVVLEHCLELYRHRALINSLVWRDVKARYRGSVLGYFWTLLKPLLLSVYQFIFTEHTPAVEREPYAVVLFVSIFFAFQNIIVIRRAPRPAFFALADHLTLPAGNADRAPRASVCDEPARAVAEFRRLPNAPAPTAAGPTA